MRASPVSDPRTSGAAPRQLMAYAPYTASSTGGSRAGTSGRAGSRNGMRASRIRRLARTRRWAMVGAGTTNAAAMSAASTPSTVCSMSGVRMPASIAGCAQTNMSSRRRSPIWSGSVSSAGAMGSGPVPGGTVVR